MDFDRGVELSQENVTPLVTIRVASESDVAAIQRCRFDVYSEEGYINPLNFPDGRESDQYDDSSVSVIATAGIGNVAVGTTRIILGKYTNLPIQEAPHFLTISRPERAGEISRLCVRDGYRDGRISIAMYRTLFDVIEKNGIEEVYVIVDQAFYETLCWIGFPFAVLGEPKDYMGLTIPAKCVISEVLPSLKNSENANLLGVTALFERPFPGSIIM
jgi:N-acyl-L-homoserine lactone synthetase